MATSATGTATAVIARGWGHERRGRCDPGLAQEKARDFGMRRARVVDVSPRRVVVEGMRRGNYRTLVFANARGCPVIGPLTSSAVNVIGR